MRLLNSSAFVALLGLTSSLESMALPAPLGAFRIGRLRPQSSARVSHAPDDPVPVPGAPAHPAAPAAAHAPGGAGPAPAHALGVAQVPAQIHPGAVGAPAANEGALGRTLIAGAGIAGATALAFGPGLIAQNMASKKKKERERKEKEEEEAQKQKQKGTGNGTDGGQENGAGK